MTSTGVSETLDGLPHLDLAPLRHLIDDLNRAKEKDVLIQLRVMEYGWCHLEASCEASLLKITVVSRPRPPVNENTKGEKDACSTSQTL